ncbi:hypothetical protein PUN28_014435 [Cardiocondyla obscurior]|uniref:Uncharacterized protein n=1 Tax=Cardiocondyla obscurior TaxID=286306 RepID=A0AAW2F3G9_9HYME
MHCPRLRLSSSPAVPCPYDEECRQRSNRSLAFARALPPFFTLPPSVSPLLLSAPAPRFSLATSSSSSTSATLFLSLLFPQISSTIFAISITRAHLFLLQVTPLSLRSLLRRPVALPHLPPSRLQPTLGPPAPFLAALPPPLRPPHQSGGIVYALRSSTRLGYGCLISLCHTQGARIRRQFLEVNFAAIECLESREAETKTVAVYADTNNYASECNKRGTSREEMHCR